MTEQRQIVRVLVVDDSTFMRKVLQSIIAADPQMEVVGEACDGREAIAMSESLRPDVISMDLMMPHVDGLQATEHIMATRPRPIVIVSSEAREGAESTLRALHLGAIDFVAKPSNGIDLDMDSVREEICRKLKLAARVRVIRNAKTLAHRGHSLLHGAPAQPVPIPPHAYATGNGRRHPLVVMAASTGGPQALMQLAPQIPAEFCGSILVVQHMPGTFTAQFSKQLESVASLRVQEAQHHEELKAGTMYICPGSHHLRVSITGRIELEKGERINGYRPCADVTMETAAAFAGPMCVGVVLTGMGCDGAKGIRAVKAAGGHVIVQDESTSLIFGMPSEAISTGAVDQVLALHEIPAALAKRSLYLIGAARVGAM